MLLFVMGANEWRAEPEWPLSRSVDTPLYLNDGSSLEWSAPTGEHPGCEFVYTRLTRCPPPAATW